MTDLVMIVGSLPLALVVTAGAELHRPLAAVYLGGLLVRSLSLGPHWWCSNIHAFRRLQSFEVDFVNENRRVRLNRPEGSSRTDSKRRGLLTSCFFVSDLHGNTDRYEKLFRAISDEHPAAVFLGGDLVPHYMAPQHLDFATDYMAANFKTLQERMGGSYPRVFLILGNDDGRHQEQDFLDAASQGIWEYAHNRKLAFGNYTVYGYSYVPPTPFLLKDWERYDVSRYVDPGCVSPEEGHRSIPISTEEAKYGTIRQDLEKLAGAEDLSRSIFLFHTPPYRTGLDRAALDGKMFDHVPLDVNVGSIAVRRFIKAHQPLLTLHGHVHESARLTGSWRDQIGETTAFSAAHDGPELALVHFDPADLSKATRRLF